MILSYGMAHHDRVADLVTFTHAFTRDLETEGHVMVYVTFVISVFVLPR